MVGLRKGHCYSKVKRPYTRKSKVKSKSFIKAVPQNKIVRYFMGDITKKFNYVLDLISKNDMQIRHNALESCRMIVNRHLHKYMGMNYLLVLRVYPHHILRENKMLAGAGADRMQKGMQQAFGRPVGLAARVKKGQSIFSVYTTKENINYAKNALDKARPRMPGQFSINIEEIKN